MDYKYHPAINIFTDWFTDIDATKPHIDTILNLGYAIAEVKIKKKYKFFGQKMYQVHMVTTVNALIAKKQELIYGTEQYELVPTINGMINMVKQSGPIIFPWINK